MRFVETKTPEQQSVLMLHRIRLTLVSQRTMLSNTIRAHMAEFGIVAPIGRNGSTSCWRFCWTSTTSGCRRWRAIALSQLQNSYCSSKEDPRHGSPDHCLSSHERDEPPAGGDPGHRPAGRDRPSRDGPRSTSLCFAAQLRSLDRLVPKQNSSGGKERLGASPSRHFADLAMSAPDPQLVQKRKSQIRASPAVTPTSAQKTSAVPRRGGHVELEARLRPAVAQTRVACCDRSRTPDTVLPRLRQCG